MIVFIILVFIGPFFWELYNLIAPRDMRRIRAGIKAKKYDAMNRGERLAFFFGFYYMVLRILGSATINGPIFLLLFLMGKINETKRFWTVPTMAGIRLILLVFCFINLISLRINLLSFLIDLIK